MKLSPHKLEGWDYCMVKSPLKSTHKTPCLFVHKITKKKFYLDSDKTWHTGTGIQ